ncbi:hypothetical protein [Flavobacterium yafengii]|uniref:hypothetical protein n=1 Tax=Flavobacterium yafengii TaxID=3041253 RepID=UPI0024A9AD93|nr:hypothetical protein [Flavobacterium yafengii]MDI5886486.1 hypothetical protein [Flavobacterium yafengii]
MNKNNLLNDILDNRKKVLELIIISIILGIGVSFISSSLFDYLQIENNNALCLSIGLFLTLVSLIYFTYSLFGKRIFDKEINGFFLVDRENESLIDIDNYYYSNKIYQYLNSARIEDSAIDKKWLKTNFGNIDSERNNILPIVQEISEYYFLESLSMHLSEFFNSTQFDKNRLKIYERNDIPDILLSNQFLELFSKPMHQRATFIDDETNNSVTSFTRGDIEGKVTSSYKNGVMFKHFHLVLPNESKLLRKNNSTIIIKNKRFKITVRTLVSGVNTYIPVEFRELYLGLDKYDRNPAFVTTYRINIEFNKFSFLKSSSWEYYKWVDSFLYRLEKNVSEKYYFNTQIEWDKIYPIIKALQVKSTKKPTIKSVK